jgi:hypothetical protein
MSLKRIKQRLASHRLVLLNPSQQLGLSAPFLFWLFHALTFRAHLSSWNGIFGGCTDAFLDTFSFQARGFYEKLGYRVFGGLDNHPAGHQHYFMTKRF